MYYCVHQATYFKKNNFIIDLPASLIAFNRRNALKLLFNYYMPTIVQP